MTKPVLKILSGPSPTKNAAGEAVLAGTSTLLSALGTAADLVPFDDEGLHQVLSFRVATARQAQQRSTWFGGRLYNLIIGEDADYVPLSGSHLKQTLLVCGIEPPDIVVNGGRYLLLVDYARQAIDVLDSRISK
ncbi:hypothetical protein SAMN05444000_115103 [Shimia gijangensis]|uniref:Uncharacterized protein n=1 Tax=Shimia gijangensis TaxID=1470563 RepID=A0A1M6NB65_9RHOB|nr:hypothetical protein [Shimia gijangensis]SHJ92776.1 hypothetical protein SAMN05444000_115103 [Shimia gijangensis]